MGLILYILSLLLSAVLFPIGIIIGIVSCFWQHQLKSGLKNTDKKFLVLATSVDKFGNVVCAELFNATLITKESSYKFGKIEQTISMVIGYNLQAETLSKTGKILNSVLDFFDKNHSIKAITFTNNKGEQMNIR